MKMEQSVPKRRHIKFRRRGITQKKTYNRADTVWDEAHVWYLSEIECSTVQTDKLGCVRRP